MLFDEHATHQQERWSLVGILLVALVVRLVGITYGLPAVYNGTEYYIAKQALAMGARHSLEPLFFVYPTFFTYIVALLAGILYLGGLLLGVFRSPDDFAFQFLVNPTFFYASGRLLTAVFFLFTLYLFFKTLRFFLPIRMATVFSLLFLFSWNIQFYTFWMVPDGLLILGSVIVAYLAVQFIHYPHRRKSLYLAAFVSGLTVSAKYNAGFLPLAPLAIAWLYTSASQRIRTAIFVLLLAIAGFLAGSPYWVLRFPEYLNGFHMLLTQSGVDFNQPRGIPFLWEISHLLRSDWVVGALVLAGIGLAIRSFQPGRKAELPLALVILPTFVAVALMQKKGLDYLLIIFPLSFILMAMVLGNSLWLRHHEQKIYTALLAGLLPGIALVGHFKFQQTQQDTRQMASTWIQTHIPPGTLLCYDNYHFDLSLLDIYRFTHRGFGARFLSPRLKKRLENLKNRPDVYRFTPIRHELSEPKWPANFTPDMIRQYASNPFLVEAYQHPFKTLHDLQVEGVKWLLVNDEWAQKFYNAPLPPKSNPLYSLYLAKRIFYQNLFTHYDPVVIFQGNWRHPGPKIYIFNINPE